MRIDSPLFLVALVLVGLPLAGCGKSFQIGSGVPKIPSGIPRPGAGKVSLTWTAPGDDGNVGTAASYDLRYSYAPITDLNFDQATQLSGVPAPQAAGTPESYEVTGLIAGVTYYFAVKTVDEAGNWSGASNSPSGLATAPTAISIAVVAVPVEAAPSDQR